MTHSELVLTALAWSRRKGYKLVGSEFITCPCPESPDVIGWTYLGSSCVIECKTSRADFLKDRQKPHRRNGRSLGQRRYFMVPAGLELKAEELPTGWGLLFVRYTGRVRLLRESEEFEPSLEDERIHLVQICRHSANPTYRACHNMDAPTAKQRTADPPATAPSQK